MLDYSKTSTIATVLAPILCIPLYWDDTAPLPFAAWFAAMTVAVITRYVLLRAIRALPHPAQDGRVLNLAIGLVTLMWGLGWFVFVQPSDMVSYLLYQIISLTVLFVGMVGYCVNWKTFFAFVLPLKVPELVFITAHFSEVVWPIALGSMVAFYLALKMAFIFSKSWEKSFALRLKNDALIAQLTEEKNASMAANLAKSEFIATASHDLRQPMQSINIFVDMIDNRQLSESDGAIFNRMRKSITVLNRMFNTLLDISKLDAHLAVRERAFHLVEIVHSLEDSFSDLCAEKKIKLSFRGVKQQVQGDAHLVEQILRNLLANAIQYTDQGHIEVAFEASTDGLSFSVKDTGCGIPEADLPLIYNEFFRSDHSRAQCDGLGLGLAIVNRIVKKINGHCHVQSEVGQGSVFTVHTRFAVLPAQAATHLQPPLASREADGRVPHPRDGQASKGHLGILENDEALLQAYLQYFTQAGYTIHIVPYEETAFHACLASLPPLDFILSDFRLGPKDGLYFIQQLREEFNQDIPACIVTADTSPQHLDLFSQHNIDVMYKPIDIHTIEKFIAAHM
ncbi:hybrid sensor histidine kinase/response regulator [Limnohabitans sp. G3-2]|uniref:hybrid sensor histidine kinase/response regulator n=1 Tax=Limnohabitans sp. G3-2 TaxID=1100711 RepID=UPI001303F9B3|nr:hybrid sensor histidine kinase/response regulator [Limnohabitans sp. G3-2]